MNFTIEDITLMRNAMLQYLLSQKIKDNEKPRAQQLFEQFGRMKRQNDKMTGQHNDRDNTETSNDPSN